jgi:DNA invertase Pin-like site-specific DNA recombinase
LDTRRANLRIEATDVDTETATGRLMLNVMFSVAQIEREMMLETASEIAELGC